MIYFNANADPVSGDLSLGGGSGAVYRVPAVSPIGAN